MLDYREQNRILGILFQAEVASDVRLEKMALLKLAGEIKRRKQSMLNPRVGAMIDLHLRRFAHLGLYYFRGVAYTPINIQDRLTEYIRLSPKESNQILSDFREQERNKILTKKTKG